MKRKRIAGLLLTVFMLFSVIVPVSAASTGLQNFKAETEYIGFSDVPMFAWYEESVKTVCKYGLMKGNEDRRFSPSGKMTLAEGLAIACRLHNIYNGGNGEFEQSSPWFQVYVDYAAENGILSFSPQPSADFFTGYVSKQIFAYLIVYSLPEAALKNINNYGYGLIAGISLDAAYADHLYTLFNAGILTGSDSSGTIGADDILTRAEASAILSRVIVPELRQKGAITTKKIAAQASIDYFNDAGHLEFDTPNSMILIDLFLDPSVQNSGVNWTSSQSAVAKVNSIDKIKDYPDNYRMVLISSGYVAGSTDITFTDAAGNNLTCTVELPPSVTAANNTGTGVTSPTPPSTPSELPQPSIPNPASSSSSQPSSSTSSASNSSTSSSYTPPANTCSYIINTSTGKFHYPWCGSVKQMNESNKWYYNGTRENVINMGYVACKKCSP